MHLENRIRRTGQDCYQDYMKALNELPIKNPDQKYISQLCPHLSPEEAITLLNEGHYLCCPPLRVFGDSQVIYLDKKESIIVRLSAYRGHRRIIFETDDYDLYGDSQFNKYVCYKKAISFAQEHWKENLLSDNWHFVYSIEMNNPNGIARTLNVAVRYDPKRHPNCEVFPESTFDVMVAEEIIGDRNYYPLNCCFLCRRPECKHGNQQIFRGFYAYRD